MSANNNGNNFLKILSVLSSHCFEYLQCDSKWDTFKDIFSFANMKKLHAANSSQYGECSNTGIYFLDKHYWECYV